MKKIIVSSLKYLCIISMIVIIFVWSFPTIFYFLSKTEEFKERLELHSGYEIQMQKDWYPSVNSVLPLTESGQSSRLYWNKKNIINPWTFNPNILIEKISCDQAIKLSQSFRKVEVPWSEEKQVLAYGQDGAEKILLPEKGILISNGGGNLYKNIIKLKADTVCEH